MRNRYVGDIGDFAKYGLLRAIGEGKRLGVAWYLCPDDGHTEYLEKPGDWRHLDPELFGTLKELVDGGKKRSVAEIQRSGILGDKAIFADEPVPVRDRRRWFERVKAKLSRCDLVFADPDNGLYPDDGSKLTRKHIPLSEAVALAEGGRPVVIYHHNGHRIPHRQEIKEWMDQLPGCTHAYYWRQYSNRTFFVMNPDRKIEQRLEKFAERCGPRGKLGELIVAEDSGKGGKRPSRGRLRNRDER